MEIARGLPEDLRPAAARLYWQAFGGKLGRIMGPEEKALALIDRVLDPTHCVVATGDGRLLGFAGFKTYESAFVGGGLADYRAVYGALGAVWRMAALGLLDRDVDNTRFLMDGIVVDEAARGRGVGTRLLEAICEEARLRGYGAVRLDVIDSNARARALYQRRGFTAVRETRTGPAARLFGFRSATTMERAV